MKFGLEMMNHIVNKILEEKLPYTDCVVIGDNSSGKTLLLKLFVEKAKMDKPVYFIDAVNRGFDVKKISKTDKKPEYKKTILDTRLEKTYFNLADSFNCFGTLTERIEIIYHLYEKEAQDLFYELTNDKFRLLSDKTLGEVDFGNNVGLLSSGYQAIIRLLLELLYYQEMEVKRKSLPYAWIVIDELDECLSPKYSSVILEFFKKKFPWGKWIVTTHSCDMVACTHNSNLIVLEDIHCEVIDINDYLSVSEVQIVFEKVFGNHANLESEIENTLRRLFNNKMNQAWGKEDEECMERLNKQGLTASQQLIMRQIREW